MHFCAAQRAQRGSSDGIHARSAIAHATWCAGMPGLVDWMRAWWLQPPATSATSARSLACIPERCMPPRYPLAGLGVVMNSHPSNQAAPCNQAACVCGAGGRVYDIAASAPVAVPAPAAPFKFVVLLVVCTERREQTAARFFVRRRHLRLKSAAQQRRQYPAHSSDGF